ncbi:hypothetical protein [Gordonia phthalatica]|uniref:Uncharacterized protein n=1 Tax=Gordonia phthalatica TaxID=1136941 RepID=A0A0N9MPK6_9ACTN|nr:hypothetical protein [Gordonia phthalatica]ALG84122.1 hypothetical protein ACH46_05880 [Gordonia phthalatica]
MTRVDRLEFAVLVVGSVLLGILTAAFLMVRVGSFPFPITAVIACAVNLLIYRIAAAYTESAWQFAPLGAWTLVTVLAMLPVFGNGSLITGWRLLLLLILGAGVPAYYASNARLKRVVAGASDRP